MKNTVYYKVKGIIEKDARYTVRDIAWMVDTTLSSVQFILKKIMNI